MYLVAQRVELPNGGTSVSLFRYVHYPYTVPADRLQDIDWVSEQLPGLLIYQRVDGRAGGRRILSFLDLSGPDGLPVAEIQATLRVLGERYSGDERKTRTVLDACGVEFFAGTAEAPATRKQELAALVDALWHFVEEAWAAPMPHRALTAVVRNASGRTYVAWDDESRALLAKHGYGGLASSLSIADDVRPEFESAMGSLYAYAVGILFPYEAVKLQSLGGAKVVDETGELLWLSVDGDASETTAPPVMQQVG